MVTLNHGLECQMQRWLIEGSSWLLTAVMKADRSCYFVAGLVIVGIIGALCGVFIINRSSGENTKLSQVHVIFSHGERTPTIYEVEIFPLNENHSEKYYPHGYNALTNKGKMTMFKMGTALRKLYDEFLTKDYVQSVFSMQTTDNDITKMSALLVLAGLWPVPSEEMWTDLAWQPVPFFNLEKSEDYMLYPDNCGKYMKEREKVNRDFLEKTNFLYEDLYQSLSNYTGTTITEPFQVKKLWNLLLAEENMDILNPKWFRTIEHEIMDVVKLEYKNMFYNTNMRRLSAGSILEKVLADSKEKTKQDTEGVEGMKMLIFSGYSHNIASILAATENLDLFEERFGSSLVIELHMRLLTTDYALKIFLYSTDGEMIDIEIGNCGKLCPVDEFEKIMSSFLLKDYKGECKQD